MAIDQRKRAQMLEFCRELSDEDGVHPRELAKCKRAPRTADHRKARQLCRQVAETLALTLNCAGDDDLALLSLESVEPAPDTSRLRVTVCADAALSGVERARLEDKLARQAGRLRCEVAATITRKKTPMLVFQLIMPDVPDMKTP